MRIGGIYIYYFNDNLSDSYIGSTVHFNRRHKDHMRELRHNKHYNYIFQAAFNKYGESAMQYKELEEMKFPTHYNRNLIRQHLETREHYWQLLYNSRYILVKAGTGIEPKTTYKAIQARMRKVYECDSDWNIINEFESIMQASDRTGLTYGMITNSVTMKTDSCNGRFFRSIEGIGKRKIGPGRGTFRARKVVCYNLSGDLIQEFDTIAKAALMLNVDESGISGCCNNKKRTIKGYIFKYKEDIKEINFNDRQWAKEVECYIDNILFRKFKTTGKADKFFNFKRSSVYRYINNKTLINYMGQLLEFRFANSLMDKMCARKPYC